MIWCCEAPMANNHWAGNDHGYDWESNESLLGCKFIEQISNRYRSISGFKASKDQTKFTDAGRRFIPKVFQTFNVQDAAVSHVRAGGDSCGIVN